MALLGNRSVLLKSPGRFFSGSTVSDNRSAWGASGATRCRYFGGFPAINATPSGYRPPYSWIIAIKNGEMSAVNGASLSITGAANGTMGLPATGSATFTVDTNTPDGQLISSGTGAASFAITAMGDVLATLSTTGSASIAFATNTPNLTALGWASATGAFSITGTLTSYAKGLMTGSTLNGGALTEASIIAAMNASPPAVNIKKVNDVVVNGNGAGTPWGP